MSELNYNTMFSSNEPASVTWLTTRHFKTQCCLSEKSCLHYDDVIMTTIASQITSLAVVYSTVYSDADQRKHQSSASLAFVWGIHRDRWIPAQRASDAENVSIWWRHHENGLHCGLRICNFGLKSTFHLHISPVSCLIAWKRLSNSRLTAVKFLT